MLADAGTGWSYTVIREQFTAQLMQGFKQLFGQTIFDYSQRLRMEHSKDLLETTDLTITEIAFELGYDYSNNFTTAFKRHFGMTPRAARLAARK